MARKHEHLIEWSDEQLEEAGIDRERLLKIIGHLKAASDLMWGTGLHVYGASSTGQLIHQSRPTHGDSGESPDRGSVVATIGEGFTGGDW